MIKVSCRLEFIVTLTDERYLHIISRHPEILDKEDELQNALIDPDFIKASKYDPHILLFYKARSHKEYIVVVVKKGEKNAFILTAYNTDFIKEGDVIWKK